MSYKNQLRLVIHVFFHTKYDGEIRFRNLLRFSL